MGTKTAWLTGLAAVVLTAMSAGAQQAVPPDNAAVPEMPKQTTRTGKHVNRVIDMWLKNQPVYYAQISGGGYEQGKSMAATKADYITYEMEHGPLDFKELREFMRGLVEAGPTRPGTRPGGRRHACPSPAPRRAARQCLDDSAGPGRWRARHSAVQRRKPGSRPPDDRSLALSVRPARGRAGAGHPRQRLAGLRVADVGRDRRGIHAHRRSLAVEPGRRIAVRPEDREPAR